MPFTSYASVADVSRRHLIRWRRESFVDTAELALSDHFRPELAFTLNEVPFDVSEAAARETLIYPILREVWKPFVKVLTLGNQRFREAKPGAGQPTFLETVEAFKVLDVADRDGKPLEVEVQAVVLGKQVAWVSLPGEIFVELGLNIKHDSPYPHTILVELANGAIGYIPSRRAYPQGNYEVISARCAEGSGEILVDAALKLLKELYAEGSADPPEASRN